MEESPAEHLDALRDEWGKLLAAGIFDDLAVLATEGEQAIDRCRVLVRARQDSYGRDDLGAHLPAQLLAARLAEKIVEQVERFLVLAFRSQEARALEAASAGLFLQVCPRIGLWLDRGEAPRAERDELPADREDVVREVRRHLGVDDRVVLEDRSVLRVDRQELASGAWDVESPRGEESRARSEAVTVAREARRPSLAAVDE